MVSSAERKEDAIPSLLKNLRSRLTNLLKLAIINEDWRNRIAQAANLYNPVGV